MSSVDDIAATTSARLRAPFRASSLFAWLRSPARRDPHRRLEAEIARLARRIDEGDTPSTTDLALLRAYLHRTTAEALDD